jgi:NTP pyrophosphatase (non-canonical NTP hydrolase)
MKLNEYQALALKTETMETGTRNSIIARVLGVVGEAGELAEVLKKQMEGKMSKSSMAEELGDVFWYVAVLARHLGINLEDLAVSNIEKLVVRYPNLTNPNRGNP